MAQRKPTRKQRLAKQKRKQALRKLQSLGRAFATIGRLVAAPAWLREKIDEITDGGSLRVQISYLLDDHYRAIENCGTVKTVEAFEYLHTSARAAAAMALRNVVEGCYSPLAYEVIREWVRLRTYDSEAQYVRFRLALTAPDYSHTTDGHPVSPDSVHVYRRANSPSGCVHAASLRKNDPRCKELLAAYKPVLCAGGRSRR